MTRYLPDNDLDTTWMARASCRGMDPDLFFPARGESPQDAIAVCATCPVRRHCLDYALATGMKHGIWGGTSELQRRRLRRNRGTRRPFKPSA